MKIMIVIFFSSVTFAQMVPDKSLTPGNTFPNVTEKEICKPGYSKKVRHVSEATKAEVVKKYIKAHPNWPKCKPAGTEKCEIDHLISLELGGTNAVTNLWPEPYDPIPGAHEKDAVENWLHRQVCQGKMTLKSAQEIITKDWYTAYLEMQDEEEAKE
jgi:hypothetical protein